MDRTTRATSVLLCIVFLLTSIHIVFAEQRVVCYYTNWSVYRPGTAKFSPQNINPYLCTHLIYAFGGFTKDNTLKPFDKYQDIEKGGYAKFNGLKTYNKKLKTMLAIGGWNEGSTRFSPLVADPERREELVKNSVKFLRQNHFDGLDLDWEYPAFRDGGKPRDKDNYADFVQELREEFERESSKTGRPRLLLSMAIPAGIEYLEKGYDLPRLDEYLDFFNLLSYDYHSAFEPAVNHHSPLYGLEEENEYNYDSELTIDYTISYLLKHGVTPNKLILGIPTYGRSYTLFNEEATEIGAPADGPGEEGDATREKGYLAYYEICENIGKSDEWEVVQPNPKAMGPYAVRGNQWVGYDDEEIVRIKAHYVNEKELGGIMFWSIDNDDFRGKCHDRPYPLIEAAKEAMLTGNNRKGRPNLKTKSIGNRKKTGLSSINPRFENDSTRHRLRTESNKRRPSSTTPSTRRRISSTRAYSRSNGKNRLNIEDNDDEVGDIGTAENSVKESTNRNKSRQRPRANRIIPKRKVPSRRGDDQLEDNIEPEEESLSNRLTTPEPPTTPDPGSDFKCQDEGFYPHPRDCKKYFWCLDSGPSGLGIIANQFTCPSGLVFNKVADSCDYPRNVACPKAKNPTAVSTTKAPITTTRTTFQQKSTRRTTTTEATNSAEEYEYEDDDLNIAEDEEEEEEEEMTNRNTVRSTTAKPLIYKTITRNRLTTPTTATTSPTEAPTTAASRSFNQNTHNVLDLKDEEDPRVLKELIDLIKKAGGLEQLEKQLNLQANKSPVKEDAERVTPATISRSLYERVLNRQAPRIGGLFGESKTRTVSQKEDVTEKITSNSRVNYQNGPGGAQFEGLDDVPEVKSLRRTNKPQYVTIERSKPSSTQTSFSDEDVDDYLPQRDEFQQDNTNVASSEEHAISNPPDDDDDVDDDAHHHHRHYDDRDTSTKKTTPSYVNIRRTRPSTPASEGNSEDRDEPSPTILMFTASNEDEQKLDANEKQAAAPKSRYTSIQRFRSTTTQSAEPVSFVSDSMKLTQDTLVFPINPTTPENIQDKKESPKTAFSSTLTLSTTEFPLEITTVPANESSLIAEFIATTRSTLTTSQQSTTVDPVVALVENVVTEIPQTTSSIITSTLTTQPLSSKITTTVAQPRPFGFSRRGRPTTPAISTTTSPTTATEQNRVNKVSNIPTRNFVRVRTRARGTTESTFSTRHYPDGDEVADDEIYSDKVVNRSSVTSRRRGSSRFTTAAHRTSIDEATGNFISLQSTEPTDTTTHGGEFSFSKRQRERLTTALIEDTTSETINRRRRPISRSNIEPLTDSPIIRISPKYFDEESIQKYRRGGFKNNSVDDRVGITNIKILKIADQIKDNNDSFNAIEATTLKNIDWETSETMSANEVTTDSTPFFITTVPTPHVTSENGIISTGNTTNFVFVTDVNRSAGMSTTQKQIVSEKRSDLSRRKVLLRRRLVVPTTPGLSDNQTSSKLNRRRKVVRRLGPVSLISSDDLSNSAEMTTANVLLQSTTLGENSDIPSYTSPEIIAVDYTRSIYTTELAINDADTISTIDDTKQNTHARNYNIESTEFTTIGYSQLNDTPETSTIISTISPLTTSEDKPIPRFIRKKFVRKRPLQLISTTPSSTTTTRRSGFSRFSSSSPRINFGSNVRRKSLSIRKRPVTTSATEQRSVNETLNENTNFRNKNITDPVENSVVSQEIDNFLKQYVSTSESSLTLSSSHRGNIILDDSSPQESAEKLADVVTKRRSRTRIENNGVTQKTFKTPASDRNRFNSGGTNTFWQRQTTETRSYPRQSAITTESSVTETLIPSKKFDFIADAMLRRQQLPKSTVKSSLNDDYSVDNEQTSVTPQTKPQVTRLVTSVVESGTTERQIIRIKTKYSSLTSTTKFPIDSSNNINSQRLMLLEKNNIFADESRHVLLNEIHMPTEQTPEKSTLPIESEFSRRGRYFTTEPSAQSSTIAIESVESKYFKELPTLKELINDNIETNRNIVKSLETSTVEYSQGIKIPVRILGGLEGEEIIGNQFALLQLPENTLNSTIWRNILRIQLIDEINYKQDVRSEIDLEKMTQEYSTTDTIDTFNKTADTAVTIPSTERVIRGFYVTKSLNESQSTTVISTDIEETTTDVPNALFGNSIRIDYSATSTYPTAVDYITETVSIDKQTTNENLDHTSTFSPTTMIDELENDLESIIGIGDHRDESTKFQVADSTTSSATTLFTTPLPLLSRQTKGERPVKQIVVHRRPTAHDETESERQHVVTIQHNKIIKSAEAPRPGNWSRRIIRKRPISESTSDQNIAETQPHQSVKILGLPTILFDVQNISRSGNTNATEEINLFRSPGTLLRKPASITRLNEPDRVRPSRRNPVGNVKVSETQYSSKISTDAYDQSSRADELLAVSISEPPTATPTIETGNESAMRIRGIQKHKVETRYGVHTELPTIIKTTITPVRRRQGAKDESKMNFDVTSPRSRRPAIIDYDYYVDEEVRLSIKPELKNKIYITRTGGIRCLDQGNFAHPTSCKKFITCAPMVGGQVIATEYTCPAKLSFDPVGGICNWSAGLGCAP